MRADSEPADGGVFLYDIPQREHKERRRSRVYSGRAGNPVPCKAGKDFEGNSP